MKRLRYTRPKRVFRLPDLDDAKTVVLNTMSSPDSQRSSRFAINDFIAWYFSDPRLAFNKTVVLRHKLQLEARCLVSSTINLRLAAVRRFAYEAADTGLLSRELAAGIPARAQSKAPRVFDFSTTLMSIQRRRSDSTRPILGLLL